MLAFYKGLKMEQDKTNYNRNQAYSFISSALKTNVHLSFVSDIYGGLSENKCRGGFGHDKEYWDSPENLTLEAFADFFSAYARGNSEEINYLQQALPTANEVFLRTMKRVTK